MGLNTNSTIRDILIGTLTSTPVALTTNELRTRLRAKSMKLPEYEILKMLRELQATEVVRLERGRWVIQQGYKTRGTLPQSDKVVSETNVSVVTASPSTQTQDNSCWSPRTSKILNEAKNDNIETIDSQAPKEFSGSWGSFRKLLRYYADCVRNDEGFEALAFLNDYGKTFLFLRQIGNWYPRSGKTWEANIPLGPNLQDFVKKASQLGDSGVLLLGYPLQVWSKQDDSDSPYVIVKPIFTYQLQFEFKAGILKIICDDPWPEINLDWLSYAIKSPSLQRDFLSICGLMDRGKGDEFFGDVGRQMYEPNLQTLAIGLTTCFSESVREPLRPENVLNTILSEKPESGIYNRAVLMIGNRTKYARSLLKELAKIGSCSDDDLNKTALRFIFRSKEEEKQVFSNLVVDSEIILENSVHEGIALETYPLNGEQRQAVAALLMKNLTVVTGPPGTGKSQVVAAAMANARLRDQTVVFSSRNHKAIDAVVGRLLLPEGNPLVVRANSKEDSFLRFGFEEAITQLLSAEFDHNVGTHWERIRSHLLELLNNRGEWGIQANKIQELRDTLGSDYF